VGEQGSHRLDGVGELRARNRSGDGGGWKAGVKSIGADVRRSSRYARFSVGLARCPIRGNMVGADANDLHIEDDPANRLLVRKLPIRGFEVGRRRWPRRH
jgi:hypothetical protein